MGQVTISQVLYDVYGTFAEAETYLKARLGSDPWFAQSTSAKSKAMVSSTRVIERFLLAHGITLDPAIDPAPDQVQEANYEYSFVLSQDSSVQGASSTSKDIKSVKAGPVDVEFFDRSSDSTRFPTTVQELLNGYLASQGALLSLVGLASGTDQVTDFCPEEFDPFGTFR